MIPTQLKSCRFVKCNGKVAIEKNWNENANYSYNKILNYKGNIGVINSSGSLIVIDADSNDMSKIITENLHKTLTIQTSKAGKNHFYYVCKNISFNKKYFINGGGDIRGVGGFYTLCPPSIHPNGTSYKVIVDVPIAEITENDLKVLKPYIKKKNDKPVTLQGEEHPDRHESMMQTAVKCRQMGMSKEDIAIILEKKNINNKPPKSEKEVVDIVTWIFENVDVQVKTERTEEKTELKTLDNVYNTIERWLFIQDRNRIDMLLATAISNGIKGTPIWMFFVGASGDTKTELNKSLLSLTNAKPIDQLTSNTLASGKRGASDLGSTLEGKSTILIISDLASLLSSHKDEKKAIFGQFRSLYDGDIFKRTGSGVNKEYSNCHVTLIVGVTPAIRNEQHIHSQLGTRELMYDTKREELKDRKKMQRAWENENSEAEMRSDIRTVVKNFITTHPIKKIKDCDIPKDMVNFLMNKADELKVLRASAEYNYQTNEITNDVSTEVPTRTIKQFKRIYKSLKSLDDNYPDSKIKEIITHIVNSTGDQTRLKIIKMFKKLGDGEEITIKEVSQRIRIDWGTAKRQLSVLWNLRILDCDMRIERVGGVAITDNYGNEKIVGGHFQEIYYYRNPKKQIREAIQAVF